MTPRPVHDRHQIQKAAPAQVAFIIDAFARRVVGWRVSRTAHAGFVLDAFEQALHERRPVRGGGLIHHSDRGVQLGFKRLSQHLDKGGCDGYPELLKLGIDVSQSTVASYMVRGRHPPSQSWLTFVRNRADGIAAVDLFVVQPSPSGFCTASSS